MSRQYRMRVRRVAGALCVGALLGCESPTATRPAFAYSPTSLTGGLLYRWPGGTRVSVWVEGTSNTPGLDLSSAVRRASAVWNAIPDVREFELVTASSIGSANIIVYDQRTATSIAEGSCSFTPSNAAGSTFFCATGPRAERLSLAAGGASLVSVLIRVDAGRLATQERLDAVVVHEFGHAVGIGGHSDDTADVMFAAPITAQPSTRDVRTLRFLLGAVADFTLLP